MDGASLRVRSLSGGIPECVQEELEQEAWLRVLQASALSNRVAFGRRVYRNLAIDYLRRRREVPLGNHAVCVAATVCDTLDAERVRCWLGCLGVAHREILRRLFLEEEDVDVLVEELAGGCRRAVGEATWVRARDVVYKRRRRGLEALRTRLTSSRKRVRSQITTRLEGGGDRALTEPVVSRRDQSADQRVRVGH